MRSRIEHKYYFIYKTTNLVDSKIYIGQHSTDKLEDGYIGHGIYEQKDVCSEVLLHRAVRKYGYKNFKREIIEFLESYENLDKRETFWIKELGSHFSLGKGYNMTWSGGGGDTISNHPRRDEFRKRNSELHKGKKQSSQHKKNRSRSMLGRNKGKLRKIETINSWKISYSNRSIQICPHCNYSSKNIATMSHYHFDNCKQNLNRTTKTEICPHCGYESKNKTILTRYHGDKCKYKQKVA